MQAIPLHNHSHYSALDGLATVEEIITRIKEIGSESVALTDHGVVSGHLEFNKKCRGAGIRPLFGMEAYQARTKMKERHQDLVVRNGRPKGDAFHLILLAQDNEGLKNLWSMSTIAHQYGFYRRPRLDWDVLEEYKKGIIATSACLGSYVSNEVQEEKYDALERYLKIFGSNFYMELHTYDTEFQAEVNLALVDAAQRYGVPVVYATDAHYACEDDYDVHELMLKMSMNKPLEEPLVHPPSLWIKDQEGIRKSLSYLSKSIVDEAIANSEAIANMCTAEIPEPRKHVPKFKYPDEYKSSQQFFVDLVIEGAKYRGIDEKEEYVERLQKELRVILDADLVDFFLIEWDLNRFAREEGILVGPGRGSIGGSLVAYCLRIHDVDPLRYGLFFERFYNAGREKGGLPDIDTDFPALKRNQIKEYVAGKYGHENVGAIGTQLRLHARSAIDRVSKLLRIPAGDIKEIKEIVASTTDAGLLADIQDIMDVAEMQEWIDRYPELFVLVQKYHDRIFAHGIHASGYLVADVPLKEAFPLRWMASKEEMCSQFDYHEAEELGFMKMDFLGLRNLDTLEEFMRLVKELRGEDIDISTIHHASKEEIAEYPIWDMIDRGLTAGIFQIEEGQFARQLAMKMKPRSIEDLSVIVALNRPGPIRAGFVELYLERRNGAEWEAPHPLFKDILEETYGVFVYQEQVIQAMIKIGFSLEEADDVRRIMGKKKPEEMKATYPKYIDYATQHMDKETADEIWESLVGFSKYAFNKAHSVEYAVIGLWTTYAKALYSEYLLAAIRTDPDKRGVYMNEASKMGVKVSGVDINSSELEASLKDNTIYMGLNDVKGVGKGSEWILKNRPFKSRAHLEEQLELENKAFLMAKKLGYEDAKASSPKQSLNAGKIKALFNAGAFDSLEERGALLSERRALEMELLGVVVSDNSAETIERYKEAIELHCDPYSSLDDNGEYFIPGIIKEVTKTKTRRGTEMAWLTLEYHSDRLRIAVFGNLVNNSALTELTPVIAEVRVNNKGVTLIGVTELD